MPAAKGDTTAARLETRKEETVIASAEAEGATAMTSAKDAFVVYVMRDGICKDAPHKRTCIQSPTDMGSLTTAVTRTSIQNTTGESQRSDDYEESYWGVLQRCNGYDER